MFSLVSSEDDALYLYADVLVESEDVILNLPSVSKLQKVIDLIDEEEIEIRLNKNHLEYKNKGLKFKYHLMDEGILNTSKKLSIAKINSFSYDKNFTISTKFLKNLLKQSSLTGTEKVYIYSEDGFLYWKLGDDSKPNSDSLTVKSIEIDFEMSPFIVKVQNLNLVANFSEEIVFKINNMGVGSVFIEMDELTLQYIMTKLTV
jgi:hypothetical protein